MTLSAPQKAALVAAAFVAVVVLVFALQDEGRSGSPDGPPRLTPAADAAPPPSADNVAPAFHARLMALRDSVETAPADTARLLALARLEQDAHLLTEAAAHYEQLLERAPEHRQARLDLALVYAEMGQWEDALATTERLLDRYPDDPAGLYNLGAIAANTGRYAEARTAWEAVAAQSSEADLAQQARGSLDRLAALERAPNAAPPLPPDASGELPAGHPPVNAAEGFQPVLAGE